MKVIQGTCGWTDQEYPPNIKKDAISRLQYYSKIWPCVEVNSSCYSIPSSTTTAAWANAVSEGFLFHFKAFGLFCSRGIVYANLPHKIRDMLTGQHHYLPSTYIPLSNLPPAAIDEAWSLFNSCLQPIYQKQKLGIIVFQFHLSFQPSDNNLAYIVKECRGRLDPRFPMAVEFRNRTWFTENKWRIKTFDILKSSSIGWIAADELEHETFQKDKEQRGLPPGHERVVLPIALEITTPDYFYVRVHRRYGGDERKLGIDEIKAWNERITSIVSMGSLHGDVYFLWGTDHKDMALRNASQLDNELMQDLRTEWKPRAAPGTIESMFAKMKRTQIQPFTSCANDGENNKSTEIKNDDDVERGELHVDSCAKDTASPGKKGKKNVIVGIKRFFTQIK